MDYYTLIWSVCVYVESRVRGEIDLEELARMTGFSLDHVRDVFRRQTGKSLSRYVQERRIANAAQELVHTGEDIIDVAVAFGFSGRDVFSRAFRRHTGYIPSQFRAEHPLMPRVLLCSGVFGAALPRKEAGGSKNA
ncbi:MAG: helix-turn-helix transcriptional regulator [Ruminococcaceae bacterium]|nr:helix-turn-helix transcriptional regulator [Oscillospiraceae bacterium]